MFYKIKNEDHQKKWPHSLKNIPVLYQHQKTDLPILSDNLLILGKTGCGKSVLTKKYIEPLLNDDNEPYTIFFEIKNDFRVYLRDEDKVISYDDTTKQVFQWNMIKEIRQSDDWTSELDKITDILFEELSVDKRNQVWIGGAKDTFKAFINTILYCYQNNPTNKEVIDSMRYFTRNQFLEHLSLYKKNNSMLRDYFDYDSNHHENYKFPKKASDIMFFLQNILSKFSGNFLSDGDDTMHDFLNDKYGRRLFLIYDYDKRASSNLFYRYFLNIIISERLSQNVDRSKKVLLILDEIAELEHDFGLMQAVTLGRANQLQVILCTQSIEKLYCIAPDKNTEHIVNASLAGFTTIISFMPGDSQTIEILQKLFGNKIKQILTMPLSRYDQPIIKTEREPTISYEDFASLEMGECYIKIKDIEPKRVTIL